jgi:hypothetical protein|tara:strand:+ start:36 stop:650 length:615 start_codon:yes stop_codon:yes gene_type:complete
LKVLIACECSGIIREAFRKNGHEAYSCDLKPDENNKSEFHIQDNVLNHLDKNWDLMIAHPVCTFICRNRAMKNKLENKEIDTSLFLKLLNADIPRICIENPVPSKAANLPAYTQIIQPYEHGHDHSKKTCLWLKNLPKLQPTKLIKITYVTTKNGYRYTKGWYNTPRNSTDRSRTFTGIANAMSNQWNQLKYNVKPMENYIHEN